MAHGSSDLVDERGHTIEDAEAQEPTLDSAADAASKQFADNGDGTLDDGTEMILAQEPEEVEAQVAAAAGAPGDEHDLDVLLGNESSSSS